MKKFLCFAIAICVFLGGCGDSTAVSYDLEEASAESTFDLSSDSSLSEEEKVTAGSEQEDRKSEETESVSRQDQEETSGIYVHVCGAVQNPGVYELAEGSRVYQALAAAGGLREDADQEYLNQAELLQDGQQVLVYTQEEVADGVPNQGLTQSQAQADGSAAGNSSSSGKVNLNTADKDQLLTLPGIGDTRAEAILAYRAANGSFASIEEIMNVEGIKEKMYEKLKDYIEV